MLVKYWSSVIRSILLVLAGGLLVPVVPAVAQTVVTAGTVAELQNAIAAANSAGGNRTIMVKDGTYTLTDTLYVNAPNITISGQSGIRENVIIQGDAMSSTANVGNVIRVAASNFQLRYITLQRSRYHLIQIAGEENADSPVIRDCIFRDAYEQMLKVSNDSANPSVTSDGGVVENCLFEYSAGVGPQYYIGGIDAHGSKNWTVRGNTFRSIISPNSSVSEFAVHFWDGSSNNTVEKNVIINCDRGIGFGMDGRGNSGGIIRNNMIYHAASAGSFADVGIALVESPNSQVYNNTVYMENGFPWGIEYRFSSTTNVLIVNNLSNKPVMNRDSASGTVTNNIANAVGSWFVAPSSGNLHLTSAITTVLNVGRTVTGLTDDFDGQARPQGSGIDIGADEFVAGATPLPPSNLHVN